MKLGAIYARYSPGPNQTEQSIEGQVADCMDYAEKNDIRVVQIYADRHLSGTTLTGRLEFQRMLKDAAAGKFQHVICWKIDRFGRDRTDIAMSKLELKKASVKLHYAKENVPDTPEGILLESLLEGLAEYYSADLRQKVSRGMRESAKKGKAHGGNLPIGYKLDENRHPIIDQNAAEAVREVFEAHIAGYPVKDLLDILNRHGVITPSGKGPNTNTVYRMLRNERYTGKWETFGIDLGVDPIISCETFEEAKKHFKTSRQNGRGNALVEYLLSCKCTCGYCGATVIGLCGTSHTGKSYNYYRCSNAKSKSTNCQFKNIAADRLEDQVISETVNKILTDEMVEYLTNRIMDIQNTDNNTVYRASLKKRIQESKTQQKHIVDAIAKTGNVALVDRLEELQKEEKDLAFKLAEIEVKKPIIPKKAVKAWFDKFRNGDVNDKDFRKTLVDTFIHQVVVSNEEIYIYYNYEEKTSRKLGLSTTRLVDRPRWKTNPRVTRNYIILRSTIV